MIVIDLLTIIGLVVVVGGVMAGLAIAFAPPDTSFPTAEEYFRRHPGKKQYVDSAGRLHVNINLLMKSPKVRAQLERVRRTHAWFD